MESAVTLLCQVYGILGEKSIGILVSSRELESKRTETLKTLESILRGLGYLEAETS